MMHALSLSLALATTTVLALAPPAAARGAGTDAPLRLAVTVENLAPTQGTYQTPFWVGFHDGTFDSYDLGAPANGPTAPLRNDALEHLAEDGAVDGVMEEFLASGAGSVQGVVASPAGPIGPGARGVATFLVDPADQANRFFSWASMVIPSNDAFVANDDPTAHPLFETGELVFSPFFVVGTDVVDAGTEVNDELPENTAFFGQQTPDTGDDENGVVTEHPGFLPVGAGGILADPMFSAADFRTPGYPAVRVGIRAATAITEPLQYGASLLGGNEVPPVSTPATGRARAILAEQGTRLDVRVQTGALANVVAVHLHLGAEGENGPIVVTLFEDEPGEGLFRGNVLFHVSTADLEGPLTGFPLDALVEEMNGERIYVNIHTEDGLDDDAPEPGDVPSGELRGQLRLLP